MRSARTGVAVILAAALIVPCPYASKPACAAPSAAQSGQEAAAEPIKSSELAVPKVPALPGPEVPEVESSVRRFENVFFISLPFTTLWSVILIAGTALAVQKGNLKLTTGMRVAGISLALGGSGLIAWRDFRAGGTSRSGTRPELDPRP